MSARQPGRRRWRLALGVWLAINALSGAAPGADGGDDASVADADASAGGSAGAAGRSGAAGQAGGGAAGAATATPPAQHDQGFECRVRAGAPRTVPPPVIACALGLALGLVRRRLR